MPADEPAAGPASTVTAAAEQAWAAIRARHPGVPFLTVTVAPAGPTGCHRPHEPGQPPGVTVTAALLSGGGRAVIEALLHRAAHALAEARGVKDTSADGDRYHNKRFAALAAEVGLQAPARPGAVAGWSACALADAAAAGYAAEVTALGNAGRAYLRHLQDTRPDPADRDTAPAAPRRAGRRDTALCGCEPPRRIQLTPRQSEEGPVICGLCGGRFQVAR